MLRSPRIIIVLCAVRFYAQTIIIRCWKSSRGREEKTSLARKSRKTMETLEHPDNGGRRKLGTVIDTIGHLLFTTSYMLIVIGPTRHVPPAPPCPHFVVA